MAGRRIYTREEAEREVLRLLALYDEIAPPYELREWCVKALRNALQMPVELRDTEQAVADIREAIEIASEYDAYGDAIVTIADYAFGFISAREHLVHVPIREQAIPKQQH